MDRQPQTHEREIVVGEAIRDVVAELRLVDLGDYVAFIRLEHFASVADIVDSAAELYFMPGTVRLGHSGEAHVDWAGEPRIVLDMELRPFGATVYFTLTLARDTAGVDVTYVAFDTPDDNPARNTQYLRETLENARLRKQAA